MIVLKIIGWILLSILALIIVALCIRVKIDAEYSDDNTFVMLQWLFLKIPLFPKEKKVKEEKPEEEKSEEDEPEEEKEEEPKKTKSKNESLLHMLYRTHGIDGLMLIVKRLFSYLGSFLGDLCKSLVVEELYIDVRCTKSDAAETAIYYGEVCAGLFPMLGALVSKYKIRKYDVNVYPDFLAKFSSASFAVKFHLYPIYVIWIVILLLCRLIFKIALRMLAKIFLSSRNTKTEKQNINTNEKRDESNE